MKLKNVSMVVIVSIMTISSLVAMNGHEKNPNAVNDDNKLILQYLENLNKKIDQEFLNVHNRLNGMTKRIDSLNEIWHTNTNTLKTNTSFLNYTERKINVVTNIVTETRNDQKNAINIAGSIESKINNIRKHPENLLNTLTKNIDKNFSEEED